MKEGFHTLWDMAVIYKVHTGKAWLHNLRAICNILKVLPYKYTDNEHKLKLAK